MMMLRLICTLLLSSIYLSSYASGNVEEEVFVKLNSATLLSGETILYTAFVNSKVTGKPSPLSKILYVELVNEQGKVVHQAKLKVENGRAFGDIFISSILSTGTYRLVAYTRWMKNFDSYFQTPIVIINPFETIETKRYSQPEWDMTFKTGSNGIILGLDNTLSYSITTPNGKQESFEGKVVDAEGNKLLEFSNAGKAFGKLIFKPVSLSKHRVVLEDEAGQFYFFDLPNIITSKVVLSQIDFDEFTVFSIQSTKQFDNIQLLISNKKGYEYRQAVSTGGSVKFLHDDLESGIYVAKVVQDNTVLDELAFYIGDDEYNELILNQTTFGKREFVSIDQSLPEGSYAVSVRRVRNGFVDYRPSAKSYFQLFSQLKTSNLPLDKFDLSDDLEVEELNVLLIGQEVRETYPYDSVRFLPEHRGELISGSVTDENGKVLGGKKIGFSVLNSNQYVASKTDANGNFVINNYSVNEDAQSYIKVYGVDNYQVDVEDDFISEYEAFDISKLQLDSIVISKLVESSVRIQIENAYFDIKKDSSYHAIKENALFETLQFDFLLDDYTRFRTVKETITEYIPWLAVRKNNGEPVVKVKLQEIFNDAYAPLIMLDGIPISYKDILEFSPFKLKRISGLSRRVYIGSQIFDGLVIFETFEGSLHGLEVNPSYHPHTLKHIESNKTYHFPDYATDRYDRIPDQREQLYWNPLLESTGELLNIGFYTSDVVGEYLLEIDGFTTEGKPIYKTAKMNVE